MAKSKSFYEDVLFAEIKAAGLPEPCREFYFHPTRKWRADLAYPDAMVLIEVNGGVYTHGRHTRGSGYTEDLRKVNAAQLLGYMVLQFTTGQVEDGEALPVISQALAINNAKLRPCTEVF